MARLAAIFLMSVAAVLAPSAGAVRASAQVTTMKRSAPVPTAAAPAARAISKTCSRATAEAVATQARFGYDDFLKKSPIADVLCGPFTGPGSNAMALSISVGAGCGGSISWGVARYEAGAWQFVLKRPNGAFLSAAGSDIREKQGHPAPNDPHCSPSAYQSRIWHWNGSRLTAGPWKITATPTAALGYVAFYSPTRNLSCEIDGRGSANAVAFCQSLNPDRAAKLTVNGHVTVYPGSGNWGEYDRFRVLPYGSSVTFRGFRCASNTNGITCTVIASGKGFLISKGGLTRVGP